MRSTGIEKLFEDRQEHNFAVPENEIERLESIRSLLPSQVTTTPELDALTLLAKETFGTSTAAATIIDEDWQRVAASCGIAPQSCSREQSICSHVVLTGTPFVIPDLSADRQFKAMPYVTVQPGFRFYAGVPMQIEPGKTVGALCLLDTRPRAFSSSDVNRLERFGVVASGLFKLQRANVLLKQDEAYLRRAAMTDPLTSFYNRAALPEILDRVVTRSIANQAEMGVIFLDFDNFKSVNDTHGHPAGDELLKQAASRIMKTIRSNDVVVRLGGDEFAIFIETPTDPHVLTVGERLVNEFRQPFAIGNRSVTAHISVGMVLCPRDGRSPEELMQNVDFALYAAKARGRNQYVLYDRSMNPS